MSHHYYDELEQEPRVGLWTRLRNWFSREEEDWDEVPREPGVRYRRFHPYHICVRREVHSLEDARLIADGLKEGVQQIINLASTPHPMRERVIDFLNGVIYAIEGSVERVSEHVFVYAPPQAIIDAPTATMRPRPDES
ncbi:MAG: cell division protein SepF [Armatimonadota bacterium]